MKKSFLYVGMLAVVLSMSMTSCHDSNGGNGGGTPDEPKVEITTQYVINGVVADAGTGNGLSGVKVEYNGSSVTTGSNGSFSIANLAKGDYTLKFTENNHISQTTKVSLAESTEAVVSATVNITMARKQAAQEVATSGGTVAGNTVKETVETESGAVETTATETAVAVPAYTAADGSTEAVEIAVTTYTPAPQEVVAEPVEQPEAAITASALALNIEPSKDINFAAGETATISAVVASTAEATDDYLASKIYCVETGETFTAKYNKGTYYSDEIPHFSTWLFNVDCTKAVAAKVKGSVAANSSYSNNSSSEVSREITVPETVGFTVSGLNDLPAGVSPLVMATIKNLEGVSATSKINRKITLKVSPMTKVDYTFNNTTVTTTYTFTVKIGSSSSKKTVKVTRYTGLTQDIKASIIGHSGGSGK